MIRDLIIDCVVSAFVTAIIMWTFVGWFTS